MLNSLFGRLALALLVLVVLLVASAAVTQVITTRLYVDEMEQGLHRELAAHLVDEQPLFRDGQVSQDALAHVFHTLMVINPRIECYLTDKDGELLAFHAPPGRVQLERIDVGPIQEFLSGERRIVRGDDPRDPTRRKVFSAAPVRAGADAEVAGADAEIAGYLYIVLAGEQYESIAERLRTSYVLKSSLWSLAAALIVSALVGLLIFRWLTRRLRRLTRSMGEFERSDFTVRPDPALVAEGGGDEIDQMGRTFERMSSRIVTQVDELRRADRKRRELVANVSHDLRTPVASIRGYLETLMLKDGALVESDRQEYLEIAHAQSERLGQLVGELFELAQLDSGDRVLAHERFSLTELVQDVSQKFKLPAQEAGVRLETDLEVAAPWVVGDLRLIERTLDNLVENALRHTESGGRVLLRAWEQEAGVRVAVADSGCGIPEAELPHIFDRSYRGRRSQNSGDESRRGSLVGAGLGLAIARKVIELHRSQIQVQSEIGVGTTFSFRLASA